jgi:hypothetical protein
MAKANPTDPRDPVSCADADRQMQGAVMALVLLAHPAVFTLSELVHELTESDDFAERDATERAVRDLAGVGLLHRQGICIWPSRAALHFEQLESGCDGGQR